MEQKLNLTFKPTFLHKQEHLIIENDFIQLTTGSKTIRFLKEEIESFRYGVKGIRGYKFYIGRIYCIDVKSKENQIISLRLKTLYRIRKKTMEDKYSNAINSISKTFFFDIINYYVKQFNEVKDFEIEGIKFIKIGIVLDGKNNLLLWKDIGLKKYSYYFTIFSKTNQQNYKIFEYKIDWNAYVVYNVIRLILKNKGLFEE
jgi:hypothetical protein